MGENMRIDPDEESSALTYSLTYTDPSLKMTLFTNLAAPVAYIPFHDTS
jgi:hypothetical protein